MPQLKLLKKQDEVENIKTFTFETGGASWTPGQYQAYELKQAGSDEKERIRYFTIASAPSEKVITLTTRISNSAFKKALDALKIGDTIEADAIDGDFLWEDDKPAVLVAGGIGVTPYRSMLLEKAATNKKLNAHLLYYGRNNAFAFQEEFAALQKKHPEFRISYIVGELINTQTILKHAPEAKERTVYLSGPEAMVEAVGTELTQAGIHLKQDWFPGYTDATY